MPSAGPERHADRPRYLFVTGRLAEFALRQVLDELAPRAGFAAEVAVLPISVAALMTPSWVARHLEVPDGIDRVILPGHCRGDLAPIIARPGAPVERGPDDLRDLPRTSARPDSRLPSYGAYRHRDPRRDQPRTPARRDELLAQAQRFRAEGADVIDLGCDPADGGRRRRRGRRARDAGYRVSIDSFDPVEVAARRRGRGRARPQRQCRPTASAPRLGRRGRRDPRPARHARGPRRDDRVPRREGVPFRIDPILEPIGFGFAASLGRYLEVRRRYPAAAIMMGVGNLTELTDVDSAGVNTLLIGFCQELAIGSVLTTAVINWARSSVRELDLARRLVYHAVTRHALPKHVEPRLVMLRDPKVAEFGAETWPSSSGGSGTRTGGSSPRAGSIYAINNSSCSATPIPSASSRRWTSPTRRTRSTSAMS